MQGHWSLVKELRHSYLWIQASEEKRLSMVVEAWWDRQRLQHQGRQLPQGRDVSTGFMTTIPPQPLPNYSQQQSAWPGTAGTALHGDNQAFPSRSQSEGEGNRDVQPDPPGMSLILPSSQTQAGIPLATTPTTPPTMTSLQQNEAQGEETRRDTSAGMTSNDWDFVENLDPQFWNPEFDSMNFPVTPTSVMGFPPTSPCEAANDGNISFSPS